MSFIYLASPYVNPNNPNDAQTRLDNYRMVAQATAHALCQGYVVMSPICHCHHIAKEYGLPKDFQFFRKIDCALIESCKELWVITLRGWQESKGVTAEIEHAKKHKKPVKYLTLQEMLNLTEASSNAK